jgi:hypothetical protein
MIKVLKEAVEDWKNTLPVKKPLNMRVAPNLLFRVSPGSHALIFLP